MEEIDKMVHIVAWLVQIGLLMAILWRVTK